MTTQSTEKGSLLFIHGFLGQARDGSFLQFSGWENASLDFFSPLTPKYQDYSFQELSQKINEYALSQMKAPRVLVAYSWGARLALHALCVNPELYAGAVLIGAHPGLMDEDQKKKRQASDEVWASRFLNEEWDVLIQDWNGQGVFQSPIAKDNPRFESEFSRSSLALALKNCSLGRQKDLRPFLRSLPLPLLWVVGEEDLKFKELYSQLRALESSRSQFVQIPHSGHRVHLDQPERLKETIQTFLDLVVQQSTPSRKTASGEQILSEEK